MAVITNYTTLQTAVGDYLARDDLTTFIPNFIQNSEEKILRGLRLQFMETALSGTISSGTLAVPADYLELKFAYIDGTPTQWLERVSPEQVYKTYPNRSGDAKPILIAREGSNFIFGPFPDSGYTVQGIYWAKPTLLRDDGDGQNWFTDNAPDLLLYGALLEASPFIQHDERIPLWRTMYQESLALVQRMERMENTSGGTLRTRVA